MSLRNAKVLEVNTGEMQTGGFKRLVDVGMCGGIAMGSDDEDRVNVRSVGSVDSDSLRALS